MTQAQGCFIPLSGLLAAGRAGDLPVCADGHGSVAWGDFARLCGGIARALRKRPEERWLVHCEHPLHFAAALLALLHAGRRAVVAPGLQPALTAQLRPAYDAVLGDGPQPMLQLRSLAPSAFAFEALEPRAARIDLYTSGSSGEPKRVEKSLHQLETEARALEASFGAGLGPATTMVATVPHHHIYGLLFRLAWPLCAGRRFDAGLCADPQLLMEALHRSGEAALVSSPAHLTRLPELMPLEALKPATRRIFSSGGPLPAASAAEYRRRLGAGPTEIYGSTESGGIAWREQDGGEDSAAWRPFGGVVLRIDSDGALCLRSPYLPDDAWLTMGDAAELLPDGRFRLKGRLDRVVKIEGKRVSLPEIEQALRRHPWVAEAAVVPLAGSRETLGAAVVLRPRPGEDPGRERLVAALRDFLLERFERVLVPRHWRFVARLPADERGKLTAAALHALFRNADDAPAA
jgi:acyl-coenzyme A synthetase/AMP-(fatty) acid ligase